MRDQLLILGALWLNLCTTVIALIVRALLGGRLEGAVLVACALGSTALLFLAYLLILRWRRVRWLLQIGLRLTGRGAAA